MPALDNTLRLRDGRTLAYAEYGDPNGRPLFYFHGFPNSRLNAAPGDDAARRQRIRVISFDRPGFGLSDFKPKRKLGDWVDDVAEAADLLGIDRFAVVALSGGGPYAAACAQRMPERITALALVSALAPLNVRDAVRGYPLFTRLLLRFWRWLPFLVVPGIWWLGRGARRNPERLIAAAARSAPPADKAILTDPKFSAVFARDLAESFRQGSRAASHEFRLYLKRWEFDPGAIPLEVHIWQGEADKVVPPSMGRYYAKVIPNARPHFFPDEGHFLIVHHVGEVNEAVLSKLNGNP
jgi:pimeloyl-ACP methyl ester carboxylesterase